MQGEDWSNLQNVLVLAADVPTLVKPVIEALHRALPSVALDIIGCTPAWDTASLAPHPVQLWRNLEASLPEQGDAISWMQTRSFDAALLLTPPAQSPYTLAYLCYLARIPVRIGQSLEFGGRLLSHWYLPPDDGEAVNPHLHLLKSAGFPFFGGRVSSNAA
ncbi:MAG TPA: hypothetical protein V6D07_10985 [Trichocoleus sp.]